MIMSVEFALKEIQSSPLWTSQFEKVIFEEKYVSAPSVFPVAIVSLKYDREKRADGQVAGSLNGYKRRSCLGLRCDYRSLTLSWAIIVSLIVFKDPNDQGYAPHLTLNKS